MWLLLLLPFHALQSIYTYILDARWGGTPPHLARVFAGSNIVTVDVTVKPTPCSNSLVSLLGVYVGFVCLCSVFLLGGTSTTTAALTHRGGTSTPRCGREDDVVGLQEVQARASPSEFGLGGLPAASGAFGAASPNRQIPGVSGRPGHLSLVKHNRNCTSAVWRASRGGGN